MERNRGWRSDPGVGSQLLQRGQGLVILEAVVHLGVAAAQLDHLVAHLFAAQDAVGDEGGQSLKLLLAKAEAGHLC